MGILQIITDEPGQINQPNVRRVKIISSDNLTTVTTSGYLNPVSLQGFNIYSTDVIDMWYGATGNALNISSPGTYQVFTPTISNGIITLNEWAAINNVMQTTVSNQMQAGANVLLDKGTATTTGGAATVNKQSGVLTTPSLTTAAASSYVITLTNSEIKTTSVLVVSWMGGTNTSAAISVSAVPSAGSATITIFNNEATNALNGTVILGFVVF